MTDEDPRKDSGYYEGEDIIYGYSAEMECEVVRAGSLVSLVEHLTHADKLDAAFNRTFLTTYTYFTSGVELLQLLVQRFDSQEPQSPIRVRVLNILRQWLESFWTELESAETRAETLSQLQAFVSRIEKGQVQGQLDELVQCRLAGVERMKRAQPSISRAPAPILPRKLNAEKMQFMKIDAREIARQLTLMESCIYAKIRRCELLHKNWQRKDSPTQNVRALIRFFNQLSGWVGTLILGEADLKKRTQVIGHLVNVAHECHELNNYSAVVAILSGLESSPIYRLGRTWAMVTQRSCDTLAPLQALMSNDNNHHAYRDALQRTMPPCIPFLGLFLKDFLFASDGNKPYTQTGLINFTKYTLLSSTIHTMQRFQEAPYALHPVPAIQEYLATQLQQSAGDDKVHELWEKSCKLEPRGRGDTGGERDTYTATGGMTTSMVVACMVLD
ncbi:ras guanine nucleotide exchange factor domain-containing protein [Aspergillus unguis]